VSIMQWDVFISHASEDKEAVARPLALELTNAGLALWLDENELCVGDSFRAPIDRGWRIARRSRAIRTRDGSRCPMQAVKPQSIRAGERSESDRNCSRWTQFS
jgi:hypothetical protein